MAESEWTAASPADDFELEGSAALALADVQPEDKGPVGWPDGVGDGRTLSPEQAMQLLGHLLEAEAGLMGFPRQRMAAHLLLKDMPARSRAG